MSNIKIEVYRHDPSVSKSGEFKIYSVPYEDGMVVLDAVNYISKYIDNSLSVRWNCKAARCGSCSAEINNIPRLMCKTKISELDGKIHVGPMRAFPLVKDLVTDVSSNYAIDRSIPNFTPRKNLKRPWKMKQSDVARAQEFRKCIECFLCQDVCHVVRFHKTDYVGPRHVIKAAALDMHPLDNLDRSKMLTEKFGLDSCNVNKCCQDVCPEHIKITDNAIIPEKERYADKAYDPVMIALRRLMGHNDEK